MNTNSILRSQQSAKRIALFPHLTNTSFRRKNEHVTLRDTDQPGPKQDMELNIQESIRTYPVRRNYFLERIRELIEIHMDDECYCIDQLCRDAGISRSHLHKKLKALTGLSTSLFVREIKLRHAKELLMNTDLNITQVAFATGFNDPGYFARVFFQSFKISPRDFRKRTAC